MWHNCDAIVTDICRGRSPSTAIPRVNRSFARSVASHKVIRSFASEMSSSGFCSFMALYDVIIDYYNIRMYQITV